MSERLEKIKNYYSSMESLHPDIQEDMKWLINRVEELEKEVERQKNRKYLKMRQRDDFMKQNQRYKQAFEYIQRAIYTQHCTKNHKWNTEFEKGQINGLIQASNIVRKAIERTEEGK